MLLFFIKKKKKNYSKINRDSEVIFVTLTGM